MTKVVLLGEHKGGRTALMRQISGESFTNDYQRSIGMEKVFNAEKNTIFLNPLPEAYQAGNIPDALKDADILVIVAPLWEKITVLQQQYYFIQRYFISNDKPSPQIILVSTFCELSYSRNLCHTDVIISEFLAKNTIQIYFQISNAEEIHIRKFLDWIENPIKELRDHKFIYGYFISNKNKFIKIDRRNFTKTEVVRCDLDDPIFGICEICFSQQGIQQKLKGGTLHACDSCFSAFKKSAPFISSTILNDML